MNMAAGPSRRFHRRGRLPAAMTSADRGRIERRQMAVIGAVISGRTRAST